MFNSTLTESARVWFDDLPPKSIDSYDDLKKAFLENFLQQKKCTKDPVEIYHIKQKEGESIGEVATSKQARKKTLLVWKQHEVGRKQNFVRKGDFQNQQRSKQRRDKFTLLIKSLREILALDKGHTTDKCMHLKRQIEEMIKAGKLSHVIKELKQGKDQPKTEKRRNLQERQSHSDPNGPAMAKGGQTKDHAKLFFGPKNFVPTARLRSETRCKENSSSPINSLWDAKIPSFERNTNSTEQEDSTTRMHNADMTRVPRHIAEHKLNVCEGRLPVKQKRRGKALERNKAIQEERLVDKAFQRQISIILEVYVDDLMIKSRTKHEIMRDIKETFKTLREINMKLNPKKCTFGIEEGMFGLQAEAAFKQMKQLIAELPTLTAPIEKEELIVYLTTTRQAAYTIIVITNQPIKKILFKSEITRRLHKWSIELGEYDIQYRPRISVKGQVLANFIVEHMEDDLLDTPMEAEKELSDPWTLFTDGSSCIDGFRDGLILINPKGEEFTYALRFRFDATNNEAETRSVVEKVIRIGYYWLTMHIDEGKMIRACQDCQFRDNPFKDWCEKLCISQCFAFVKNPQANGLVERANISLGEGIKARLDERSKDWVEEIPHVLWAHHTMIKSSNGDTPFSLTYETEEVIQAEISMPTLRTDEIDMVQNDEALKINLDLLEERREQAVIHEARQRWKNITTQKSATQFLNLETSCTGTMRPTMQKIVGSLALSGKDRM
nr:reverse transcriptase domain-containing protein [Tanacetum cinerariifolium]